MIYTTLHGDGMMPFEL